MFVKLRKILTKRWSQLKKEGSAEEHEKYLHHIQHGYPSNHTYRIKNAKLFPKYKLFSRYKKIHPLLPTNLSSIAEIGCSKGFFLFSASDTSYFNRGLGIDVDPFNIEVCHWVKKHLKNTTLQFEHRSLHDIAENIENFGGPFQTLLILNTYQYLYFGSDFYPECYLDHDTIFSHFRKVCNGRVIFNNRIDLIDCQNIECINRASELSKINYSREKALEAAAKFFTIKDHGTIGKYPLLVFDAL